MKTENNFKVADYMRLVGLIELELADYIIVNDADLILLIIFS